MLRLNILLTALLGAIPSLSYAEVPEQTTFLDSVTVSASPVHEHEAHEVPSQIDLIDAQQKAEQSTGSLGEMLSHLPGVNNQGTGAQAGKPVIRGLGGERVKILSNGVSSDYQAYGTRHQPALDPYLANRIEVIRGPQSVLYGSEALGGVVNLLSEPLPFARDAQGQAAFGYNSNNQETHLGVKVGSGSKNLAIQAGASWRDADLFTAAGSALASSPTPKSPPDNRPLFVGEVPFTNYQSQAANFGIGWRDTWGEISLRHQVWQMRQNFLGIEAANPNSAFVATPTGQQLRNAETQLAAEFYTQDWVIKPSWNFLRNEREAAHDLPYETMATQKGEEGYLDLTVRRQQWKLAAEHPPIGDFSGEIGVEISRKAQQLYSGHLTPSADENRQALYLFEEADYDRWLLQLGARYDWSEVKAPLGGTNQHFVDLGIFDASNHQRDFAVWSGSFGATYRLNERWSLAANLARGFRAPSIFELYAGGEHGGVQAYQIGNPLLKAETAWNTDLALRWQSPQTQFSAVLYQNRIDNYIYLANTGFYRAKEGAPNEGERVDATAPGALVEMQAQQTKATLRGLELSANHRWNAQWQTYLAFEWLQGLDEQNQRDLPLIPANNLLLANSYLPSDWQGLQQQKWTLETKWVAAQQAAGVYEPFAQFDALSVGRASTAGHFLCNLRYSATLFAEGSQQMQLNMAIENLFDRAYVDFLDTYKGYTLAPARHFSVAVQMRF